MNPSERLLREERLAQYRTVVIESPSATRWYALDLGCAPLRAEKLFDSGEKNIQEATLILDGEPDAILFDIPTGYARVTAGELFNRPEMDAMAGSVFVPPAR